MSADLDRDLGAWTRQELSREQLLAVHGTAAAALVAVHERLTGAAAAVPLPNAEAGWAALRTRIDAPAPVVPLHRPRPSRILSIAAAAALVLAGIAYAVASRGSHDRAPVVSPASTAPSAGSFSAGGGSDPRNVPAPTRWTASSPAGGGPSAGGRSGRGGSGGGDGSAKPGDDPHDRDQGTGNDGSHNDHGSGNDGPEGSDPPPSHRQ